MNMLPKIPCDPCAAAAELVNRFRRQRPLRAGSLIVTIFGDSIMPRGGAIALKCGLGNRDLGAAGALAQPPADSASSIASAIWERQ